jgi:tetratricopeptide (TPR) repeat protein
MKKASELLKAKDYANAIVAYEQIMAADPTNGRAALQMGQAYNASGNQEKAEEAFAIAAANGQEKQANKQLSNLYVKKASAALKAKNNQEAYDFAMKSNEYLENANAYKIAGQCAMALGKTAEGLPLLEKYLELSPNAKDANQMKFNIAATAQKLGDKEKAKAYYEQVLADPKFGPSAQKQIEALNK